MAGRDLASPPTDGVPVPTKTILDPTGNGLLAPPIEVQNNLVKGVKKKKLKKTKKVMELSTQAATDSVFDANMSLATQVATSSITSQEISMATGSVIVPKVLGKQPEPVHHSDQVLKLQNEITQLESEIAHLDSESTHLILMVSEKNRIIASLESDKVALEASLQTAGSSQEATRNEIKELSAQLLAEREALESERHAKKETVGTGDQFEEGIANPSGQKESDEALTQQITQLQDEVVTLKRQIKYTNSRRVKKAEALTEDTKEKLKSSEEVIRALTQERDNAFAQITEAEERARVKEEEAQFVVDSVISNQDNMLTTQDLSKANKKKKKSDKSQPILRLTSNPPEQKVKTLISVIIVVDRSGSMAGGPTSRLCSVIDKLIKSLKDDVEGDVDVGFVHHGQYIMLLTGQSLCTYPKAVSSIDLPYTLPYITGMSETYEPAITATEEMLGEPSREGHRKFVVILGDGGFGGAIGSADDYGTRLQMAGICAHYIDMKDPHLSIGFDQSLNLPAGIAFRADGFALGHEAFLRDSLFGIWK